MAKKLISELNFLQKKACKLFCNNKAAINIFGNPVQHDRTNHVKMDRHFIKEKLEKKINSVPFVRSKYKQANILTKVAASECF